MQVFNSSLKFKLFLISKLPMAWIAGLKKLELTSDKAVVGVRYGYWTQNPFKSMYFAVMAMAAELSTGLLVLSQVYKSGKNISTLVYKMQADFNKKAIGKIRFICDDGPLLQGIIQKEGQTLEMTSIGYNENNEQVAKFVITWSMKVKSKS
jgi:hypothetical protein